jgi:EAL domain-containing protein (putative c-di-GMP-specific phosphodiesterase class I)
VVLRNLGVRLFQGYLFAKPAVEALPRVPASVLESLSAAQESALLDTNPAIRGALRR